jgi:hypothetical protein
MRILRGVLPVVVFAAGGAALGLLFSCLNAGFAFVDIRYHLKWTVVGLIGGLALRTIGLVIACWSLDKRGGAVAGLFIGAVAAPVAVFIIGQLSTPPDVPGPGVFVVFALLGGLFATRIGLSWGPAEANRRSAGDRSSRTASRGNG